MINFYATLSLSFFFFLFFNIWYERTVGSTRMVSPGVMSPRFSASSIMDMAIRSLTLLAGFCDSNLHTTCATASSPVTRFSCINGVLPTNPSISVAIFSAPNTVVGRVTTAVVNAVVVTKAEVGVVNTDDNKS